MRVLDGCFSQKEAFGKYLLRYSAISARQFHPRFPFSIALEEENVETRKRLSSYGTNNPSL
jgi:hypothetical protein